MIASVRYEPSSDSKRIQVIWSLVCVARLLLCGSNPLIGNCIGANANQAPKPNGEGTTTICA